MKPYHKNYSDSDKSPKTAEDYYQEGFTRSLINDLEYLHDHPEAWEKPALSNADLCPAVNPFGDKGVTVYRGRNQIKELSKNKMIKFELF